MSSYLDPHHHDPYTTGRVCPTCGGRIYSRITQTLGDTPTNSGWEVACKKRCIDGSGVLQSVSQFATEVRAFLDTVDTIPEPEEDPQ